MYAPFCGTRGDMCGPVMAKHHGRKLIIGEGIHPPIAHDPGVSSKPNI